MEKYEFFKDIFFRIFDIKMGLSFLEYKYHIISEISLIQRQITYYSLRWDTLYYIISSLVYVEELLDILENRLDNLVCIFCEKVFKSREVLKEHMRKKNHKKINPRNAAYDKFYLINYLEMGKSWEQVSRSVSTY